MLLQQGNSPVRAGSPTGMDDLGYSALQLLLAATTFLGNSRLPDPVQIMQEKVVFS